MAETKHVAEHNQDQVTVGRAKDFWGRYSKVILIASAAIIILCGGYLAYKYLVKAPKEEKAIEAIFKAEEYYRLDSLNPALNGDGINAGFLKIIKNYDVTIAGSLAKFYAGDIYLKLGDFNNAVKQLKDCSTDAKQSQARAYELVGDAYAE